MRAETVSELSTLSYKRLERKKNNKMLNKTRITPKRRTYHAVNLERIDVNGMLFFHDIPNTPQRVQ